MAKLAMCGVGGQCLKCSKESTENVELCSNLDENELTAWEFTVLERE